MTSESIFTPGICDGCSYKVGGWVEQERTRIPIDKCEMVIWECQNCPSKAGFVHLTFDGCKIKFNVNPYFVNRWIKARDTARGVNVSPPTNITDFGPGEYV